jgi:phosphate starvation-inducible protein PhoH
MLNTYEQANWAYTTNTGVNMAKRARKTKKQQHHQQHYDNSNVIHVKEAFRQRKRHVTIIPRNIAQEDYVILLGDQKKEYSIFYGSCRYG